MTIASLSARTANRLPGGESERAAGCLPARPKGQDGLATALLNAGGAPSKPTSHALAVAPRQPLSSHTEERHGGGGSAGPAGRLPFLGG